MAASVPAKPSVSIVIPCFNQGEFLEECLASLRAQSRPDWCAIVLDDASTDGKTPGLCDAQASDRVRVVHVAANLGRALVRNEGFRLAETEAVLNLDADDCLAPTHLERTVPRLLDDPRAGIVYTDYQRFGSRHERLRARPFDVAGLYRTQLIYAGSLVRRSAWEGTRGYCGDFSIGNEDWDFWLTLVEAGWLGRYVPEPLYRYRCHPTQWTTTPSEGADRLYRSRLLLWEHHRQGFEHHGASEAFLGASWRAEALRLDAAGDRPAARKLWKKIADLRWWDGIARWRGR